MKMIMHLSLLKQNLKFL
nr:unnamed protein product [Callosobruchus chinensis]